MKDSEWCQKFEWGPEAINRGAQELCDAIDADILKEVRLSLCRKTRTDCRDLPVSCRDVGSNGLVIATKGS